MTVQATKCLGAAALAIALLTIAIGGCGNSRLGVRVTVLNPEFLHEYQQASPIESLDRQARLAKKAIGPGGALSLGSIEDVSDLILKESASFERSIRKAGRDLDPDTLPIAPQIMRGTRRALLDARNHLSEGIASIEEARMLSQEELEEAFKGYRAGQHSFVTARSLIESATKGALGDLDELYKFAPKPGDDSGTSPTPGQLISIEARFAAAIAALRGGTSRAQIAVDLIVSSAELRGDPLLGHVLQAPEDQWLGVFNRAIAVTYGTNSDIAIVMDDVDKFSIKGLRVDSSAAAKATFAVLGRVMDVAAAVSGVPIAGIIPDPPAVPTDSDNNSQPATAQPRGYASSAGIEAEMTRSRQRLVRLIDAVMNDGDASLTGASAPDANAKERIAARLESAAK